MALHLLLPGAPPASLVFWLGLLLTYFLHSLVWAGAAALYARAKSLSSKQQHGVWKVGLLGPLVTTGWATALPRLFEHASAHEPYIRRLLLAPPLPRSGDLVSLSPELAASLGAGLAAKAWAGFTLVLGGAALLGLMRFCGLAWSLRRALGRRRAVQNTRLLARLAAILPRTQLASVTLSESAALSSPLVLGASEICIPEALLSALPDAELDSVLAHELAHLERRDGLWFPLAGLVQSLFWMQPTNHWLAERFRASAELACDDRAVELTGDPLSLARALARVAECVVQRQVPAMLPSMARSRSALLPRVRRLLRASDSRPGSASATSSGPVPVKRPSPWRFAGASALAVLVGSVSVQAAARGELPGTRQRGATAGSPLPAQAELPPVLPNSKSDSQPSQEQLERHLEQLGERDRELQHELQVSLALPDAERPNSQAAVRALELTQELRHVRASAAWIEQRLIVECEAQSSDSSGLGTLP